MSTIIIGISDMKVSNTPGDKLITYSLGSCLGLLIYDPVVHVAGLLHCMLPQSSIDKSKAAANPFMFVDTGVPMLFKEAYKLGADKKRIIVKAAGCASLLDEKGLFKIGERNFTILRKMLWKNNVLLKNQHVGASLSRTVSIDVSTGKVILKTGGKESELT